MTGARLVTKPGTSLRRLPAGGKHRKQPLHRKTIAEQRISARKPLLVGALAAALVAVLGFGGQIATWTTENSTPVADPRLPSPTTNTEPTTLSPSGSRGSSPGTAAPAPFPYDDGGFLNSPARCPRSQPASAIGRTTGSLVVICGEQPGRYTYLGVRLSDAAVLRTTASTTSTGSARGFLARRAGVLYAVNRSELRVTAGSTVIKREPMIEYRDVAR
jgi:hypothetical protein